MALRPDGIHARRTCSRPTTRCYSRTGHEILETNGQNSGQTCQRSETALGPFEKPKDYYRAVASHRDRRCTAYGESRKENFDREDLPALFSLCMSVIDDYAEDTFGLANRDLGPNNLLVDEDFNVVALIDLDFGLSAPLHVVASLPHRTWSELDPGSSDLGGKKRVKEYLSALEADRPDFRNVIRSRLAKIWAELERLDHAFDDEESLPIEVVRWVIRFVIQDESFVEGR